MPVLHQRSDGMFYVRAWIPGTTNIGTWQLTPQGVEHLKSLGVNESDTFDRDILKELVDKKHAFTYGTGLNEVNNNLPFVVRNQTSSIRVRCGARLSCVLRDNDWRLAVRLRPIPSGWIDRVHNVIDALANWSIMVDRKKIPAIDLRPDREGRLVEVQPKEQPYRVEPSGKWPECWSVEQWYFDVAGLNTDFNLFDPDSGERLPDRTVTRSTQYTLILPSTLSLPSELQPYSYGTKNGWSAWQITIPDHPSQKLVRWLQGGDVSLRDEQFRLALLTPPLTYNESGQPVIQNTDQIIVAIKPIGQESDREITYALVPNPGNGLFSINIEDLPAHPLHIEIRDPVIPKDCDLLSVSLHWSDQTMCLRAFDQVSPISLTPERLHLTPSVNIHCPIPVTLTIVAGQNQKIAENLTDQEAAKKLKAALSEAIQKHQSLSFEVDGGVFGAVTCEIIVPETEPLSTKHASVSKLLRRLSQLLSSPASTPSVPLSAAVQQVLQQVACQYGYPQLAGLRRVPSDLIPVVHTIVRAVEYGAVL